MKQHLPPQEKAKGAVQCEVIPLFITLYPRVVYNTAAQNQVGKNGIFPFLTFSFLFAILGNKKKYKKMPAVFRRKWKYTIVVNGERGAIG